MFFQNRKFFRLKQVYSLKKQKKVFNLHSTAYANKSKLTPHKVQLNTLFSENPAKITKLQSCSERIWLVSKLILTYLGTPAGLLARSPLGITQFYKFINGLGINNYVQVERIYTYIIVKGLKFTPNHLYKPISHISTGNQTFSSLSTSSGIFTPTNHLECILPSGQQRLFTTGTLYYGSTSLLPVKQHIISSKVRGIAKNPVDHPNGGRANTKGSFKTPWGSFAKKNK